MSLLSTQALEVSIGGIRVAAALELEFRAGEFWVVLGPNGAGKTTLLNTLAGLHAPDQGEVLLDGAPIRRLPRRGVARRLGLLQQHTQYWFDATVMEIALTGRHPHLGLWEREDADAIGHARAALERMDLLQRSASPVTRLSGGEARRLAIAALLVQNPDILLLDEPTNHLDPRHQGIAMGTMAEQVAQQGKVAIAATHDLNLAARYCSHVLLLHGDGQWQAGHRDDCLTREHLQRLYRTRVEVLVNSDGSRRFSF